MIAYGIGVLPLIKYLQDTHPRVTQLWYADDAGAGGGGGGWGTSCHTSMTSSQGDQRGDTYRNRPRVSLSWPRGKWQGWMIYYAAWE